MTDLQLLADKQASMDATRRTVVKRTLPVVLSLAACAAGVPMAAFAQASVVDCTKAQGEVWRLVSEKTVLYACQDNPANEVVANFFETDPATIRLERGDRTVTMWLVRDGSPGYYEGQNVSLVHKGNEVTVNWLNTATGQSEEMQCRVR